MKQALGLGESGGLPYQLAPLGSNVSLPIPAEPFHGKAPSLKKIFNAEIKIYVTPDQYFTTKFREIFQKTKLSHTSAAESKRWLGGPDINIGRNSSTSLFSARHRGVEFLAKSLTTE